MSHVTTVPSACAYASASQDDDSIATSSGSELRPGAESTATNRRRRHSFFIPRRRSIIDQVMESEERLLLKVDLFLTELERRLDFLESYCDLGNLSRMDSMSGTGLSRAAFSTLQAVRTRCSDASGEVIGEGRRRLHVMVETLLEAPGSGASSRFHETALTAAETLHEKARVGLELLESMLSDFELRAYKLRERGLADAATYLDEGRRVANESIERAVRAAVSLEEHIQQAVVTAKNRGLLMYDELPTPWQANPHIKRGYRFTESKLEAVRSMFNISNEFINIWSHASGLILVLSVAFYFYPSSSNFPLSTKTDIFVAAVFFVMACLTLVCSTIWHTMNAVADVNAISLFACVDYTGISLLIAASIMTTEYTAFYCDPLSRWIYMSVTTMLGAGGVLLTWHPKFNKADLAWTRVSFFVGLALTGFLPILQLYITHGPEFVYDFYSPISKSLLVYFGGACIYASQIPERWCPGMFDYIGGSHNLWHAAVLGGIIFHYTAMQQFFTNAFERAQHGCPSY